MTPTTDKRRDQLTLGSLFDGSGGFPLAGINVGITPVWASEIEPFPILLTTTRFPNMRHVGDITKLNGASLTPVDVITFGSPCTNLSVAGNRQGLAGKDSRLFFEAVRVIREMRKETDNAYPRYVVWENVPGALWSNKGADFHQVLQQLCHLKDETLEVPLPDHGKWTPAGLVETEHFSLGWRVLDAQYFGVAQRRKRIYLVCDLAGERARQILFEPQGLPLDPCASEKQEQDTARHTPASTPGTSTARRSRLIDFHPQADRIHYTDHVAPTLTARMGTGGNNTPLVLQEPAAFNLTHAANTHHTRDIAFEQPVAKTLDCTGANPTCNQGGTLVVEAFGLDRVLLNLSIGGRYNPCVARELQPTLVAKGAAGVCDTSRRVRRLTPLECARLQGFPDTWTDKLTITEPSEQQLDYYQKVWDEWNQLRGVKKKTRKQIAAWLRSPYSDSALYKLWGNGIALPCAEFVLGRIAQKSSK